MAIKTLEASSIPELVTRVLEITKALPSGSVLWYRGISCSEHKLLPKLMRHHKTIDQVLERERRLATRFRQRSQPYWPSGYPQNDWEHMFAMQHYGLPTRLLDWSENLFVAAYFALSDERKHPHDGECTPVIWCLDPVTWNRRTPGLSEFGDSIQVLTTADDNLEPYRTETNRRRTRSPVAIYGTHNSQRIVAQRGTFTVWGGETRPMEEYAESNSKEILLWKIALKEPRANSYRDLHQLGFGETMVFPELPALAAELDRMEDWR